MNQRLFAFAYLLFWLYLILTHLVAIFLPLEPTERVLATLGMLALLGVALARFQAYTCRNHGGDTASTEAQRG